MADEPQDRATPKAPDADYFARLGEDLERNRQELGPLSPGYFGGAAVPSRSKWHVLTSGTVAPYAEEYRDVLASTLELVDEEDTPGKVASEQTRMLAGFYTLALGQSDRSFQSALIASGIGLLVFAVAVVILLLSNQTDAGWVTAIAGGLVEVISGLLFVLQARAGAQLKVFYDALGQTQRYLLAQEVCSTIEDRQLRDAERSRLVRTIVAGQDNSSVE